MFDYAGETLTDLFSGKKDDAVGAAKDFFDKVRAVFDSATVLLVLINLESFVERDLSSAGENKGTLVTAMSAFLERLKLEGRSCRVCFIFTAYDQYKPLIKSRWGSVKEFLEREIPPLYYEFVDEQSNVKVLPVAAVGETEARVDPHDGRTIRYPKPGFQALGFDPLVQWLVEAVGESKVELDAKASEAEKDQQNIKFLEMLAQQSLAVASAEQIAPIDRFLTKARAFPFPNRPNVSVLEPQRVAYINDAKDRRAVISARVRTKQFEIARTFLKIAGGIVGCLVIGWVGIALIGALQERFATENCTACSGSGKVKCVTCQSGYCLTCGGDGRIGEGWNDGIWQKSCPDCGGGGNCPVCRGTGEVACSTCNGTGKVYKHRAVN